MEKVERLKLDSQLYKSHQSYAVGYTVAPKYWNYTSQLQLRWRYHMGTARTVIGCSCLGHKSMVLDEKSKVFAVSLLWYDNDIRSNWIKYLITVPSQELKYHATSVAKKHILLALVM